MCNCCYFTLATGANPEVWGRELSTVVGGTSCVCSSSPRECFFSVVVTIVCNRNHVCVGKLLRLLPVTCGRVVCVLLGALARPRRRAAPPELSLISELMVESRTLSLRVAASPATSPSCLYNTEVSSSGFEPPGSCPTCSRWLCVCLDSQWQWDMAEIIAVNAGLPSPSAMNLTFRMPEDPDPEAPAGPATPAPLSSEDYLFVEARHPSTVLQGLNSLRLNNAFCDVTLCCGGQEFPCHRIVLASFSSYFQVKRLITPCIHTAPIKAEDSQIKRTESEL